MTGTAYRGIVPARTEFGRFISDSDTAVFVLDPSWIHDGGVTDSVIVTASQRDGETCIYPCDETGLCMEWIPIEVFPMALSLDAALLAVGYRVLPEIPREAGHCA